MQHKRVASGKPWEISSSEQQIAERVQHCLKVRRWQCGRCTSRPFSVADCLTRTYTLLLL